MYRNTDVYKNIADEMQSLGLDRTDKQCRVKIKALKSEYRTVKDNNNTSGKGRKTCKFYDEIDSILGHTPAIMPRKIISSSASSIASQENYDSEKDDDVNTSSNSIDGSETGEDDHTQQKVANEEMEKEQNVAEKRKATDNSKFKFIKKKKASNSKCKELTETRELLQRAIQSQQDEFKTFVDLEKERMKQEQAFELEKMKMEFKNQQSMLQIMMQSQHRNINTAAPQPQQGGHRYTQQQQNVYPERDEPSTSSDSTWYSNLADRTYWNFD